MGTLDFYRNSENFQQTILGGSTVSVLGKPVITILRIHRPQVHVIKGNVAVKTQWLDIDAVN